MEKVKFFRLKNGDIRYPASYVKASGKPYLGRENGHKGWDSLNRSNLGTWEQFKWRGLPLPEPEHAVAFVFICAHTANHYKGLYPSEELRKIREEEKEQERRRLIVCATEWAKKEEEKNIHTRYALNAKNWYPYWKGVVKVVDIRLSGEINEIEDLIKGFERHLKNQYEIISTSKSYENRRDEGCRVYLKTTRKKEIYSYKTRVAGVHIGDRQFLLTLLTKDTSLYLEREPKNEHDSNAVKVMAEINGNKEHIGYIHATFAVDIAPLLDKGEPVVIQNEGVVKETFGNNDEGWHEYEQLGVRIKLAYEDFTSIY